MATPNYKKLRDEILPLKENFKHGHSMTGQRDGDTYKVYSYSTLIASYDLLNGTWWINPNKYSQTTSKQQTIIRYVAAQDGWEKPIEL
jgi:hypothetical protein